MVKKLNLTGIGRTLNNHNHERSNIRLVDRFLSNKFFQQNCHIVYQRIINQVVGNKIRPVIIVDWTKLPNTNHEALRAAYFVEGRAITLYEEVHPKKVVGNATVHKKFLEKFESLLSPICKPIVVTDAGFKNPWFREILKLEWDYIGRIRGKTLYGEDNVYKEITELFSKGTSEPKYLGRKMLTSKNKLLTSFYIYKSKIKGRKRYTKSGKVATDKDSKNYSRSYREPWLLVSSLDGQSNAKRIINIYKKRMTIEEAFRDMKSSKYGLSMENNKTIRSERLCVWMMLAALSCLIAWIFGYNAERKNLHYHFQANSTKHRRVLSFFYLGCQVIKRKMNIPIQLDNIFDQERLLQ